MPPNWNGALSPPDRYRWVDWESAPTDGAEWAHHGLAITSGGKLVAFDQAHEQLVLIDPRTATRRSVPVDAITAHGITVETRGEGDRIWIADIGVAAVLEDGRIVNRKRPPQVIAVDPEGRTTIRLEPPRHDAYLSGRYLPTSVAVDARSLGGSGDIWVADGYGQSLVHRFDAAGTYRSTLEGGRDGALPFACPHAVHIDRRGSEPELLVADRQNSRIQVFGLDGQFRRSFGEMYLTSPTVFAALGDDLLVADLRAHLAIVDRDGALVDRIGSSGTPWLEDGWPNVAESDRIRAPTPHRRGVFRSPHGVAVGGDGRIFVVEWLVGGRMVELVPAGAAEASPPESSRHLKRRHAIVRSAGPAQESAPRSASPPRTTRRLALLCSRTASSFPRARSSWPMAGSRSSRSTSVGSASSRTGRSGRSPTSAVPRMDWRSTVTDRSGSRRTAVSSVTGDRTARRRRVSCGSIRTAGSPRP